MADVRIQAVTKHYGANRVLSSVDLDVADGEFVVVVGPSGCGKSTLLRIIAGLEETGEGKIGIGGEDVSHKAPAERGIAMVFQTYALYPHKTVFDNMGYGLKLARRPKAEIRTEVLKAAQILGLEPYLDRKPAALSGGQRQRVAIGRAIVRNPKVFLFDEPLSNLDAALRGQMRIEIADLHARLKATMLYVTHDQVEAMTMADRIVVLDAGRIVQQGAPLELYHHPINRFVAEFLGAPRMNILSGRCLAATADHLVAEVAGVGRIEVPCEAEGVRSGDGVSVGIRPHHLRNAGADNGLILNVRVVEPLGDKTIVYGGLDGADTAITAALDGDTPIAASTSVRLSFEASNCHVFRADGTACHRLVAGNIETPSRLS